MDHYKTHKLKKKIIADAGEGLSLEELVKKYKKKPKYILYGIKWGKRERPKTKKQKARQIAYQKISTLKRKVGIVKACEKAGIKYNTYWRRLARGGKRK